MRSCYVFCIIIFTWLCLLCSSAPEIVGLLSELNDAVEELESKINPIMSKVNLYTIPRFLFRFLYRHFILLHFERSHFDSSRKFMQLCLLVVKGRRNSVEWWNKVLGS